MGGASGGLGLRFDGAGSLWAGGLGAVVNKTPPTLQKQAGSSGLHQIVTQRGGQGVNKTLQCVGVTV